MVSNSVLPSRNVLRPSRPSTVVMDRTASLLSQSSRPALATYKQAIRESMFAAPQPTRRKPAPHKPTLPPSAPHVPSVPPTDPLADAVYAGSVTIDGKTLALIENKSSKEGVYVDEDGQWQGYRIVAVSPSKVSLSVNGTIRSLSRSDTNNIVPLSASASRDTPTGGRADVSVGAAGGTSMNSVLTTRLEAHF